FWELGLFYSEAKGWYKKGLAEDKHKRLKPDPLRVEALCCYASFYLLQDNFAPEEAIMVSHEALEGARALGDERLLAVALQVAGGVLRNQKKHVTSRQYLQESETIFQKLGDLPNRAKSIYLQ